MGSPNGILTDAALPSAPMRTIPFSPPRTDERTIEAVAEVLRSGWITTGPKTRLFEDRITAYTGARRTLCLNSWTNAAELALRWFGVGPGDEVIVPVYTYAASANIIIHTGARPVFIDTEKNSFHTTAERIRRAITPRTKVVLPVDIGGFPVDYVEIASVCEEASRIFAPRTDRQRQLGRPLFLSDAAHSFGARYNGEIVGKQADICAFSFHAVKNLTTAEGGALTLNLPAPFNNDEVWRELAVSGLHGQTKDALSKSQAGQWEYDIVEAGYKCNLTDIQAAIGLVELDRYESETLLRRRHLTTAYASAFEKCEWAILPELRSGNTETSHHLFMLRIRGFGESERNGLIQFAGERGIALNVHFQPLPRLSYYRDNHGLREEDFPEAMSQFVNEVSLPVYYDLTDDDLKRVVETVIEFVEQIRPVDI